MTVQDKAKAYDQIIAIIGGVSESKDTAMKCVGHLTKKQGIKGFKPMEIGEPVFELNDRYILVMETLDGKNSAQVPYYKEALAPYVELLK